MTYQIIENYELPKTALTRSRVKGNFALTLEALEVNNGFEYESHASKKLQYPRVSPRKFGGKVFRIAQLTDHDQVTGLAKFGVVRIS